MRVDLEEGIEAVAVRQGEVEKHEARAAGGEILQPLREPPHASELEDRIPPLGEHLADETDVAWIVLDQQYDLAIGHGLLSVGQRDDGKPEIVDGLHHLDELLQVHRLGHVAVRVQRIGLEHVLLCLGGGEDHHRNAHKPLVGLDLLEHLAAVLLRQVEVEQDDVGLGRVLVGSAPVQEVERLDAVLDPVEVVVHLALLQRLARQARVSEIVLDQEDLHGRGGLVDFCVHVSPFCIFGSVKWNVLPSPYADSTQIRPRWRSTTFLHIARPIPVPGYSSCVCKRWNTRKMRSKYCGSIPMPLSATKNRHSSPASFTPMWMRGASFFFLNLIALATRFCSSCVSCVSSALISGRESCVTSASLCSTAARRLINAFSRTA